MITSSKTHPDYGVNKMTTKSAVHSYIKENGITVAQFSENTGIPYDTSVAIVYGKTLIPGVQSMKKINEAYPDLTPNKIYRYYFEHKTGNKFGDGK